MKIIEMLCWMVVVLGLIGSFVGLFVVEPAFAEFYWRLTVVMFGVSVVVRAKRIGLQ